MQSILILEDEESVNRGITYVLEKDGYTVLSCTSIKAAEELLRTKEPQLIICDLNLPDGNGLEFIRQIRSRTSAHIICLTAWDQEIDQVMGYEAGADDYVTKPFSLSVLTLKVNAFFKKQSKESSVIIQSGNLCFHLQEMTVWIGEKEVSLTKNELKMLRLFLNHPKLILSKNQLLAQLFDEEGEFVEENTVAVNVRRLREKIEEDPSHPQYIKNIRGIGYVWNKECKKY